MSVESARGALLGVLLLGCGGSQASARHEPHTTSGAEEAEGAGLTAEQVVALSVGDPGLLAPGAHGELRVMLSIAPGYHVMSNPPSKPNYIPTTVQLEAEAIRFGAPTFPAFTPFRLWDEVIDTLQGEALIRVPFQVLGDAAPGTRLGTCTLRYQACSEGSCLFPFSKTVAVSFRVHE